MAKLPEKQNTTEHAIESRRFISNTPRPYLGMSSIGVECMRKQWYGWKWSFRGDGVSARIQRIFTRGHEEEKYIIKDLVDVGVEVFLRKGEEKILMTGEIGEEQEEIIGAYGHSKGHPDGRLLGVIEAPKTEHLLEMKTMNLNNFKKAKEAVKKHGSLSSEQTSRALKEFNPVYYAQMQMYMGKLKLTRGLFIATCKDNQERLYLRIKFSQATYKKLCETEEAIITSELPPPKKYKATYYICQWCSFFKLCHLDFPPDKNCRTCEFCDIEMDGKYSCSKKNKTLNYKRQLKGCNKYKRKF